jgi:hypothetical protein
MYGFKPSLILDKKTFFKTKLGGVITVLTVIFTLIAIWFLGNDIFYRINPKILVQPQKDFYLPPFLIDKNHYQFSFLFKYNNKSVGWDNRIVNVTYIQYEFRKSKDGSLNETFIPSPSHKCDPKIDFPNDPDRWNFVHTKKAYCFSPNKTFYIENSHDVGNVTNPERHLRFEMTRCKNNSEPGVVCLPKEEQDRIMQGSYIIWKFKDSYIDPVNYSSPESKFWADLDIYMDPNLFKTNYITLKKTVLITDSGFFFQSLDTKTIYKFDKYLESSGFSDQELFMQARIVMDTTVDYVYRSYIKVWDLAALAGGIFKLVQTLSNIINMTFSDYFFYNFFETKLMKTSDSVNVKTAKELKSNFEAIHLNQYPSLGTSILKKEESNMKPPKLESPSKVSFIIIKKILQIIYFQNF